MTTGNEDYSRLSPDVLLQVFLRKRLALWFLVATGIHVVALLLTSGGYIRDKWVDPDGAAARKAAAEAAEKGVSPAAGTNESAAATGKVAAVSATGVAETNEAAATAGAAKPLRIEGETIPNSATNSAIVRKITEAAKPEEIPDRPDLGINLEDTRSR
jgi:hypothetical protein